MCSATEATRLTVATRNIPSIAFPKLTKLLWLVNTPSNGRFQKRFMPTIANIDMTSTSNTPTLRTEENDAMVVSRMRFMPSKGFSVLINLTSFEHTRNIRATTMMLPFVWDAADTIEMTTTMKSTALKRSRKYLLRSAL
jgi:hypothetical protein